jgi:hypothetical protein
MEPTIYFTLTFSSDNNENSSLSYRRIHLPANKAKDFVDLICKFFGGQTESLPKTFDALFSNIEFVEKPKPVESVEPSEHLKCDNLF